MYVDAGNLNRQVQIQQRTSAPGEFGHPVNTWGPVTGAPTTVWASIKPLGGNQRMAAMAQQADLSHTVLVRYHPAFAVPVVAARWRIVYGSRTFAVQAAREIGDSREWIMFDVQEGGADGH